ncbi:MAG: STAS domain-containing protein [Lachnospiraceae bacterium]|nr:STAS domain-containing protein [Lachnospiraceae bacterium]
MDIKKALDGENLTISLTGRLDTLTSPELEKELQESLSGVKNLVFDFADLEYISSAGLRVLLSAHKQMFNNGNMVVKNINETVSEVFEVTGFSDVLNIE